MNKKFIIMKNLSIENKISSLSIIASFVEQFGAENNLSQKHIFELNLILDELITNTINYGYSDDEAHMIEISMEIENENILVKIIDDGNEFNPLSKEEVNINENLDQRKIGGLGIHIVKQKTDEIKYERKGDKNIVRFVKNLTK
ncbi:MAG: ATP-binding protein [Bacteroidetes bacterium]|nr:ATP-binding protein [Bacteroidota bacterium]MBU1115423.1 ATP-binding protein [Bacteroidota bacterium]MBU1797944.1 ATP-binding protein [Bacteroidota bacterium]